MDKVDIELSSKYKTNQKSQHFYLSALMARLAPGNDSDLNQIEIKAGKLISPIEADLHKFLLAQNRILNNGKYRNRVQFHTVPKYPTNY